MTGIIDIVRNHNSYREGTLNLQVSENILSPRVREALASDMSSRYSLEIEGEDAYGGTRYSMELREKVEDLAKGVYGAAHAEVRTIGGHIAAASVLLSLIRKRESILAIAEKHGGYTGYAQGYLPSMFGFQSYALPFDAEKQEIDFGKLERTVEQTSPKIIVLGQSFFVKPYDLKAVRDIADRSDSYVVYDGSHVMGLIGGGAFQPDVMKYCDVLYGSTHKTFFGPQGGIVLTDSEQIIESVRDNLTWRTMDNYHISRVAALGIAMEEMKKYGKEYAAGVVSNTKKLAGSLAENGIPVRHAPWFSESHQTLVDEEKLKSMGSNFLEFSRKLESNGIIVDREGRIGSAEATRMGIRDIERLGPLISDALKGLNVKEQVRNIVGELSIKYCEG